MENYYLLFHVDPLSLGNALKWGMIHKESSVKLELVNQQIELSKDERERKVFIWVVKALSRFADDEPIPFSRRKNRVFNHLDKTADLDAETIGTKFFEVLYFYRENDKAQGDIIAALRFFTRFNTFEELAAKAFEFAEKSISFISIEQMNEIDGIY